MKQMSLTTILLLLLVGLLAGMMSSLVGIGGGIIIVPALVLIFGLNQKAAQGTSLLLLSMPVAFAGAYNYYKAGHADWKIAVILALAFVIGGFFGSKVALGLETIVIKRIFAVFMIIIAVKYLFFDK
jgi:uncharacterized membrane protein YfcA